MHHKLVSIFIRKIWSFVLSIANYLIVFFFLLVDAELCHLFTNYVIKSGTPPIQGIKVMAQAVDKIRLFDSQLTPIHADLCQLSLCAKIFNPVLKFLDIDITAISTTEVRTSHLYQFNLSILILFSSFIILNIQDNNHDAKYFLLYYYYGGMIYSAVKNYERALYFFEVAVSTPALAMSYIMLESYKKYILVSLILEGKISSIPKYSSQVITRFVKPLSHAYHELANAYETLQSDDVRNVINKYRDVFVRDVNLGLVKQVAASLYKKNIQRLTQTFLTLSLIDVANKVHLNGPNEAEKYILDMIKSGEIFASINQKDGMVVFKDDPEKYNTPEMFQSIQEDITQVMELNKQIVKMEEEIKLNPHVRNLIRFLYKINVISKHLILIYLC